MRNIFTFLFLLFISCNLFAQNKNPGLSILRSDNAFTGIQVKNPAEQLYKSGLPGKDTGKIVRRLGCSPQYSRNQPLLLVDRELSEMSGLEKIDISKIESVYVLQRSEAIAIFGPQGAAGVILITTKGQAFKTLLIQDFLDGAVIPGATVSFISYDKSDTLMYVADSDGRVSLEVLKKRKGYSMSVSSSGYMTYTGMLSDPFTGVIKLERDFKTGPEVVISSGIVYRCGRGCGGHLQRVSQSCDITVKLITDKEEEDSAFQQSLREFRIYPNPVQRGQLINAKLMPGYFQEGRIQVLSMEGRLLLSLFVSGSKKQGLLQLPTDQRWAAGIYILQLVYANGRVGASEKVIIQ